MLSNKEIHSSPIPR